VHIHVGRARMRVTAPCGNGQFSRLSALDVVTGENGRPWRGVLLEDCELSLHLMMAGHRNEYTEDI
jgi:1,2-diacylglycerol 3-beta-glucosyltransferase